jgi:mRNA interferase MazF
MHRMFRRGEIWWANLNPGSGTEPGKIRPVLILQNEALLEAGHPSTIVIPLTTNLIDDAEPLRIRIPAQGLLEKDSDLLIDQVRAIDNQRLVKGPLLQLDEDSLEETEKAINEVLGISGSFGRGG